MSEPSGIFRPNTQCFRCGYWTDKNGYILFNPPNDDNMAISNIMRYGPTFAKKFNCMATQEDQIDGLPIRCCSIECCLDMLSDLYKEDEESFSICCIILSKTYNVRIPGLEMLSIDGPQVKISNLNKNPKLLKRWGGNQTYDQYRQGFTMPDFKIEIPEENDEIGQSKLYEETEMLECFDEEASEGEFDTLLIPSLSEEK